MKIGVDLDGVIFDSEKEYRVYSELFDLIDLEQNSKINNKELRFQERFKWSQEDVNNFVGKYQKQIMEESNFMPGAKRILNLLKEEGNSLVLITARGGFNEENITVSEKILKENNMDIFDKYYWAIKNKEEICIKENIDIMIDDSYKNCKNIADEKIKVIYLKDSPCYELNEDEYIKVLYNWGEIYRYIKEMQYNISDKSCGCVVFNNKKILLVQQLKGFWSFPKGHIECNETEIETAIREVKEETNIDVKINEKYRYEMEYITDKGNLKSVVFFVAERVGGELEKQENEISNIGWFTIEEAFDKITYENYRNMFKKICEDLRLK